VSALISACGKYRYRLDRDGLSGKGTVVWIMVNPSTADATEDDATIRRVRGFSQRLGFARFTVGNLFAYRATDVRELRTVADPIGPRNDDQLHLMVGSADLVIVAWGPVAKQPPVLRDRFKTVIKMIPKPMCLGVAQDGHPRHPLMLANDTPLQNWRPPV
jgi:hypothetical protein